MRWTFHYYRVSLVPQQRDSLFQVDKAPDAYNAKEKSDLIEDAIFSKTSGIYRNTRYQFLNANHRRDLGLTRFRIARPGELEVAEKDPKTGDLVDATIPSYPWTHAIYFGEGVQIIAVARRSDFYSGTPSHFALLLQRVLEPAFEVLPFAPNVIPKTSVTDFWSAVENADSVRHLHFDLIPPNVFGGAAQLLALLNRLRSRHNAVRYQEKFSGGETGLSVDREDFDGRVTYVAEGGGKWDMTTVVEGKKLSPSSSSSVVSEEIDSESEDPGELDDDVLQQLLRKARSQSGEESDNDQ